MNDISKIYQSSPEEARELLSRDDVEVNWESRIVTIGEVEYGSIDKLAEEVLKKIPSKDIEENLQLSIKLGTLYQRDPKEGRVQTTSLPLGSDVVTPEEVRKKYTYRVLKHVCDLQNELLESSTDSEVGSVLSSSESSQSKNWFDRIFRSVSRGSSSLEPSRPSTPQRDFLKRLGSGEVVELEVTDSAVEAQKKYDERVSDSKEKGPLSLPLVGCNEDSITIERVFLDTMVRAIFRQAIGVNEEDVETKYKNLAPSVKGNMELTAVKNFVRKINDEGHEIAECEEELKGLAGMFLSDLSFKLGEGRTHLVENISKCLEQSFMNAVNARFVKQFEDEAKFEMTMERFIRVPPAGSSEDVVVSQVIQVSSNYRILNGELIEAGTDKRKLPFPIKVTLEVGFSHNKESGVQTYKVKAEKLTEEPKSLFPYPIICES